MTDAFVYLNGSIVPAPEARVSVYDQGLLYGYGVFETMRAYQGRVFRQADHLARLVHGAEQIGLFLGGRVGELDRAVNETLVANGLSDARIRLTATAGESTTGPTLPARGEPTILVTAISLSSSEESEYERGWRVVVATRTRHSQSVTASSKTTSYLENLVARAEAVHAGADEALIMNERSCLSEGSMTNVFMVKGRRLLTPGPDSGLLRGITRQAIITLAEPLLAVSQEWISLDEAVEADEVFVTNSAIEVMPVTTLAGRAIGDGTPGEVTRDLTRRYQRLVVRELGLTLEA